MNETPRRPLMESHEGQVICVCVAHGVAERAHTHSREALHKSRGAPQTHTSAARERDRVRSSHVGTQGSARPYSMCVYLYGPTLDVKTIQTLITKLFVAHVGKSCGGSACPPSTGPQSPHAFEPPLPNCCDTDKKYDKNAGRSQLQSTRRLCESSAAKEAGRPSRAPT